MLTINSPYSGMAIRDHYKIGLKCPKCGKTGTAEASESDHGYGSQGFLIDKYPVGFAEANFSDIRRWHKVMCLECKVPFQP
jgi:hypothetical protein